MRIVHPTPVPDATAAPNPAGGLTLSNGIAMPPAARPLRSLAGAFAMPFADYLKHPALGRSVLDKIKKSPLALQHYLEHGDEDTPAFLQGRVLHRLLLEPKEFWVQTVVWRGGDDRRAAGYKAFAKENEGKDIITKAEEALFLEIEEVWRSHDQTKMLLAGAEREAVTFWMNGPTQCKARADIVYGDTIYDLKTTSDLATFEQSAWKFGYHRQAAWYLDGFRAGTKLGSQFKKFKFVVVEKSSPADFAVFTCDEAFIEAGRQENARHLALYQRCVETGVWPGYAPTVECVLTLPNWLRRDP